MELDAQDLFPRAWIGVGLPEVLTGVLEEHDDLPDLVHELGEHRLRNIVRAKTSQVVDLLREIGHRFAEGLGDHRREFLRGDRAGHFHVLSFGEGEASL